MSPAVIEGASAAVVAAPLLHSGRQFLPGLPEGALRSPLRRLSYAFGLLPAYYFIAPCLPRVTPRPFNPSAWPADPANLAGSYFFHFTSLVVCWITNHMLRAAI